MAKGQKTGGRQKGTRNKATVRLDAKLAEATERAIASLLSSEVASMSPLDAMEYAMRLELQGGHWRSAAARRRLLILRTSAPAMPSVPI